MEALPEAGEEQIQMQEVIKYVINSIDDRKQMLVMEISV